MTAQRANHQKQAILILEVVPGLMKMFRQEMRKFGSDQLTVPQFRVLNRIAKGSCSNQELADWMGVSAPTMSKMLDSLIQKNLITRKTEATNRRQVVVDCTFDGKKISQEIQQAMQNDLIARISKIPEPQMKMVESGLMILRENLL